MIAIESHFEVVVFLVMVTVVKIGCGKRKIVSREEMKKFG
jgi:hypothetical protein